MNCQEVEKAITDLARGVNVDQAASDHVRECGRCRERLAEQRKITAALRAWAGETADEGAPAAVEEALLKAFRRGPAPARRSRVWIPVAVAASIAAVVLLTQWRKPSAPVVDRAEPLVATVQTASAAPAPVVIFPPAAPRRVKARPVRRVIPPPAPSEVDFVRVAQGDSWTPLDGGRLVRIQLPRSAMRGFGLPVMEERSFEQVQADVMLSNDGLVRAIRFVP